MPLPGDYVLRAMTTNHGFRVMTARSTTTVQSVIDAQKATGDAANHLGNLVTAAALLRETMAPSLRLQMILKPAQGSGMFVADAHPGGGTRGLVQSNQHQRAPALEDRALLQVMRTLHNGTLQQGVVEVEGAVDIARSLMTYLQQSEQSTCVVGLGTVVENQRVVAAGGYILQLLPEADRESIALMAQRLEQIGPIEPLLRAAAAEPQKLLEVLLGTATFTPLEESPLSYACICSEVRLLASIATLPRAEIEAMVKEGKTIEITCDFCNKDYGLRPEQLRGLLRAS